MNNIQTFQTICQELYEASDKTRSYDEVVLLVLQTKYSDLLPEDMTPQDIADVLDISYSQVASILAKLLGNAIPSTGKAPKSLLRKLAHTMNLKDHIPDPIHLDPSIEHEMVH